MWAVVRWVPFVAGCAAIFAVSGMHRPPIPEDLSFAHSDKLFHAAAYAGLCVLAMFAAGARRAWLAFVLTVLYGVTDEVHQGFVPGRESSGLDLVADAAGAGIASLATLRIAGLRARERRAPPERDAQPS